MVEERAVKAKRAKINKKAGGRFEADVRKALDNMGQFVYVKGMSTKGIDVLGIKKDDVIFIELKSHSKFSNTYYKDAMEQLAANDSIVNVLRERGNYKPENITYILMFYVRNESLTIENLNGKKEIFEKTHKINIVDFIQTSLLKYMT